VYQSEKSKVSALEESIKKLTDELTHRDTLLNKVEHSLKSKMNNESLTNINSERDTQRYKTQINQ